ncbi:uncharacterized protein [Physcomitrium patens]|nr:uncharacterized protein LOC112290202 [Physcomitrium patens]|eukprot:XP_024392014.1 uncharacterized protein LOC112290202 [Physcomitrella patens]
MTGCCALWERVPHERGNPNPVFGAALRRAWCECCVADRINMMRMARALPELWRYNLPASMCRRAPLCKMPLTQEEPLPEVQQLVVTASGPDRPGIVARLSKRVLDCGGNVEVSRMARLAGEFSILMLVTFDITTARKAEQLRNSLLQIEGLQVNTRWTANDSLSKARPQHKFRKILLRGVDNPGLVYNLTEYLSSHGINIESLETYTQEVSPGSPPLFMMEGVIAMPVGLSTATFIHNLDTLQATLGAEISITELLNPVRKLAPSSLEESS